MLEFLGLEEEAMRVVLGCILIGLPVGAVFACAEPEKKKATVGQTVFATVCILMVVVGLLVGGWPGVVLFFTFQWKALLGALFQGAVAGVVSFLVFRISSQHLRRKKYMRNPVIREAADFCKQHGIVGIQCFPEGMRFLTKLEHPDHCKSNDHQEKKETQQEAQQYQNAWVAPEACLAHDRSEHCAWVLKFSDRDYPNVPDLPMFASALAKMLGGFGYAKHYHSVQYDTVTFHVDTKTTTHNITVLRDECFVYSRAAYKALNDQWKQLDRNAKPEKTEPLKKPNTWE